MVGGCKVEEVATEVEHLACRQLSGKECGRRCVFTRLHGVLLWVLFEAFKLFFLYLHFMVGRGLA